MKYVYLPCIVILCLNVGMAQSELPQKPYHPLNFVDLNPLWYKVNYDPSYISDSCDGYNYFFTPTDVNDLIEENFIFSIYHTYGKMELFTGTYLIKRDLQTGELLWRRHFGAPEDERQELGRLIYLNEDKNIVVISQLKPDPYGVNYILFGHPNMMISKRIYDFDTGDLMYMNHPDYNDTTALTTDFNYFQPSTAFYFDIGQIKYFELKRLEDGNIYHVNANINETSKKDIQFKKLKVIKDGSFINAVKIKDDRYLLVELSNQTKQVIFRYVNGDLELQHEYKSDSISSDNIYWLTFGEKSDDNNYFLFYNRLPRDTVTYRYPYEILIFDDKANLLKKIPVNEKYGRNIEVIDWIDLNTIKMFGTRNYRDTNNNLYITLDLLQSDAWSNVKVKKSYFPTDSLRFAIDMKSYNLGDGKLLLKMREGSYHKSGASYVADHEAKATSMMLLDIASLGISGVVTEDEQDTKVEISPNPASDNLGIRFDKSYTGIVEVFNVAGQRLYDVVVSESAYISIDTQSFVAGAYIIKFTCPKDRNYIFSRKFIKLN